MTPPTSSATECERYVSTRASKKLASVLRLALPPYWRRIVPSPTTTFAACVRWLSTSAAAPVRTPPPAPLAWPPSVLPVVPMVSRARTLNDAASIRLLLPCAVPAGTTLPMLTVAEVLTVLLLVLPEPPTALACVASVFDLYSAAEVALTVSAPTRSGVATTFSGVISFGGVLLS